MNREGMKLPFKKSQTEYGIGFNEAVNKCFDKFEEGNWNDYTYIYQDSLGHWNIATNPVFIAEHKCCRAVPKSLGKDHLKKLLKG